ncbi:MAG: hypothetical protein QXX95_05515 [Nitrososphaerales archaeon]
MKRAISKENHKWLRIISSLIPLILLFLVVYLIATGFAIQAPTTTLPIERINIERIVLNPEELVVTLLNSGPNDVEVAQVLVNDAIWGGFIEPSNVIPRLGRAILTIPYPWVEGEPLTLTIITSNGFKFKKEIEAAILTPPFTFEQAYTYILIGVYVGIIPVFLGEGWFPFLRGISSRWFRFLLSFTAGMLIF